MSRRNLAAKSIYKKVFSFVFVCVSIGKKGEMNIREGLKHDQSQ